MVFREGYVGHSWNERRLEGPELVEALREKIRPSYTLEQVEDLEGFLTEHGAFEMRPDTDGSLPAAGVGNAVMPDYLARWLRDQMLVAGVELNCGDVDLGVGVVRAAMRQALTQRHRFRAIIHNSDLKYYQNNRPHIRWGAHERELPEEWGHAQNDALGHYLRVFNATVERGLIEPREDDLIQLGYHARYLEAVNYWQDEDHGCWEERPKINNSSISIAKQGLESIIRTMQATNLDAIVIPEPNGHMSTDRIEELAWRGKEVLDRDLPNECVQGGDRWRGADAALLVPVWTGAITGTQADQVVERVHSELTGHIGIKRYHNDKYWGDQGDPQWCLFDSMESSIEGRKSWATGPVELEKAQIEPFNRHLQQLTTNPADPSKLAFPEMYYIAGYHGGTPIWIPNPNTPLLWTIANSKMAFHDMKASLRALATT